MTTSAAPAAARLAAPPVMLSRPLDAGAPLPPLRTDPVVVAVHEEWRRVAAAGKPAPPEPRGRKAAPEREAAAALSALIDDDRALLGSLIRAVDTLAARCDELGGRLASLEAVVDEFGAVTSEEVTRLRAAVLGPATAATGTGTAEGVPSPP